MSTVVVFGAGMVARPIVRYLLDQPDVTVVVATRTVSKAQKMIDGHPRGVAKSLDVKDMTAVEREVEHADLVVSLLPYTYHVPVAQFCIKHRKHLVTTSYVSDPMRALDGKAKEAGVMLLNECGLDPGIDHMSAMRIIHDVAERGGKVTSFRSSTGALPAHEANTNPFGYKFSWSPRGVLLASRNAAKWLEGGVEVDVPGERLFENYYILDVPGAGSFENYPNRNSVPYKEIYGLLSDQPAKNFRGKTYGDVTRHLVGAGAKQDLVAATAAFLGVDAFATVIKRLQWLGLFSDRPLPTDRDNPLDYLNVLTLEKMSMEPGDRDMIVMHHEFLAQFDGGRRELLTSTLVDYGIPGGDTSVARTVALPAAIAVKMILSGTIGLTGCHIPVTPDIYNPILDELDGMGITFVERKREV
jgi:saccharopine dehydrogenase (NADP+, L-glutamate forming)